MRRPAASSRLRAEGSAFIPLLATRRSTTGGSWRRAISGKTVRYCARKRSSATRSVPHCGRARAFVQQHDRARRQIALDARDHRRRIAVHASKPRALHATRARPCSLQRRGDEGIGHADHGAEPARRRARDRRSVACAASICARIARGGSAQNQACGWVVAVVADVVAASHDLAHQFRPRLRRARRRGRTWPSRRARRAGRASRRCRRTGRRRWSARRRARRRQAPQHRAEQARIRPQRRPRERQVRHDHRRQAHLPAPAPPQRDHQQLRRQQAPRPRHAGGAAGGAAGAARHGECMPHRTLRRRLPAPHVTPAPNAFLPDSPPCPSTPRCVRASKPCCSPTASCCS